MLNFIDEMYICIFFCCYVWDVYTPFRMLYNKQFNFFKEFLMNCAKAMHCEIKLMDRIIINFFYQTKNIQKLKITAFDDTNFAKI